MKIYRFRFLCVHHDYSLGRGTLEFNAKKHRRIISYTNFRFFFFSSLTVGTVSNVSGGLQFAISISRDDQELLGRRHVFEFAFSFIAFFMSG